jgi:hypothetical protein
MTLVRSLFLALAVMLPTTWTVAQAADPAPAGDAAGGEKKEKKAKKGAKKEGAAEEKKPEEKK